MGWVVGGCSLTATKNGRHDRYMYTVYAEGYGVSSVECLVDV